LRSGRRLVCVAEWSLLAGLGCGVFGPPGGDAQYPAVRAPAHLPEAASAPSAAGSPPSAAPAPDPGEGEAGSTEGTPTSRIRLLRHGGADAGAAPESSAPAQGYLPDPPPLSERARWLYEIRYDRGNVHAGSPQLECLDRAVASPRRIGRFAFELWLGAELIERIRFDFPLLAAEVPRQGERHPLREEPSFAPGARVSIRLQVPASTRATRAQVLDRATGQATPVEWPPRPEAPAELCKKAAAPPTSAAH